MSFFQQNPLSSVSNTISSSANWNSLTQWQQASIIIIIIICLATFFLFRSFNTYIWLIIGLLFLISVLSFLPKA